MPEKYIHKDIIDLLAGDEHDWARTGRSKLSLHYVIDGLGG